MKTRPALGIAAVVGLWLLSLNSTAADVVPKPQPVAIPVSVANQPAGSVECQLTLGPTAPVTALAFSPDGKTLAAAGYQEVVLWDLAGAKLAQRIAAGGRVGAVAFLHDGQTLVVGEGNPGSSGAVRLLELATGKEIVRSDLPKDVVCSLALSPDGTLLAACAATNLAYVWNVAQLQPATTIQGHGDRVLQVAFSPDGKFLATAGADSTAQVWNVGDWTSVAKFTEAQPVRGAAFHPDGIQVLLAVGGPTATGLRFRKLDTPTFRRPIGIGTALPLGMVGPSKGNRVYVPCSDKTVKVFDIRNGNLLTTLSGHQDWVYAVAVSPDETQVASGSGDGTVKLWNSQDHRLLATLAQLAPRADKWLILAAQGYLATSAPEAVAWKAAKVSTPPDQLTAQLQNPESVGKVLAGEKVPPPVLK